MDEGFSGGKGERWTETGNVFQVEEGVFGELVDVMFQSEMGVKDYTEVVDV